MTQRHLLVIEDGHQTFAPLGTGDMPAAYAGAVAGHTHTWNETPNGVVDGANATFALAGTPAAGSLLLFKNGLLQRAGAGNDYTLSGLTVTFLVGNLPQLGDILLASYTT